MTSFSYTQKKTKLLKFSVRIFATAGVFKLFVTVFLSNIFYTFWQGRTNTICGKVIKFQRHTLNIFWNTKCQNQLENVPLPSLTGLTEFLLP